MNLVTLSSKYQVTLPRHLVRQLGRQPQDKFLLEPQSGGLLLRPLSSSLVNQVAGSLSQLIPDSKKGLSFARIRQATQRRVARHLSSR